MLRRGLLKALMYDEQTMGGSLLVKVGQILNGSIMIVALLILILCPRPPGAVKRL